MPRLRTATLPLVALVAVGALLLGACSSDDDASSKKTTTTEAKGGSKSTTTTISKEEWDSKFAAAKGKVDDAKGDVCQLLAVSTGLDDLPNPTTAAQGKDAVDLLVTLLNDIADTAPPENAQAAAAIRKTADAMRKEGEDSNYSDKFLAGPKALEDSEFGSAMQTFSSVAQTKCGTTSTTAAP